MPQLLIVETRDTLIQVCPPAERLFLGSTAVPDSASGTLERRHVQHGRVVALVNERTRYVQTVAVLYGHLCFIMRDVRQHFHFARDVVIIQFRIVEMHTVILTRQFHLVAVVVHVLPFFRTSLRLIKYHNPFFLVHNSDDNLHLLLQNYE